MTLWEHPLRRALSLWSPAQRLRLIRTARTAAGLADAGRMTDLLAVRHPALVASPAERAAARVIAAAALAEARRTTYIRRAARRR